MTERPATVTRQLPAGARIAAHRHAEHQIVYAGRGVLAVTTDAGSWVIPSSRAIWVPAGVVHEHRAYGVTDLHTVGLPVGIDPVGRTGPTVLAVGPLLREVIIAYGGSGSGRRDRLRAVLVDELRTTDQLTIHLPTARDPRLAAVCDLLRRDPADGRGLPELAALNGLSRRSASRLFREDLGMTFPQWRTQLRLHLALRLLAEGHPVTAVAHRCGWSTPSAFTEVFRRVLGVTPARAVSRQNLA